MAFWREKSKLAVEGFGVSNYEEGGLVCVGEQYLRGLVSLWKRGGGRRQWSLVMGDLVGR